MVFLCMKRASAAMDMSILKASVVGNGIPGQWEYFDIVKFIFEKCSKVFPRISYTRCS